VWPDTQRIGVSVWAFERACARVCACICVCVHVCAFMRACVPPFVVNLTLPALLSFCTNLSLCRRALCVFVFVHLGVCASQCVYAPALAFVYLPPGI